MTQSNFSFLSGTWSFLSSDALAVEKYAQSDPRVAAIYGRRSLETGMKWLFDHDTSLNQPYQSGQPDP